jgi:CheY-like chemotaxis protein
MKELEPLVFVVDDDQSVRMNLANSLAKEDYAVEIFASAGEYLARVPHPGPACIVLEVQLPGFDGLALQRRLTEEGRMEQIVFITGHTDIRKGIEAMKRGAVDFLPAPQFAGKTRLGRYSDSMLELDDNIGRILDAIRAEAPNTIVITTADNGAWQDAWPDAGTHPYRGEKGTPYEGGWRVPGIMWWPGHIPAGVVYHEMMTHIDCWATLASRSASPAAAWRMDRQ